MEDLKQKISQDTYLQNASAEHGGYAKGFTSIGITETSTVALPDEDGLLGQILNPHNLNKAYLKVRRNKGSHGVDGVQVKLSAFIKGWINYYKYADILGLMKCIDE